MQGRARRAHGHPAACHLCSGFRGRTGEGWRQGVPVADSSRKQAGSTSRASSTRERAERGSGGGGAQVQERIGHRVLALPPCLQPLPQQAQKQASRWVDLPCRPAKRSRAAGPAIGQFSCRLHRQIDASRRGGSGANTHLGAALPPALAPPRPPAALGAKREIEVLAPLGASLRQGGRPTHTGPLTVRRLPPAAPAAFLQAGW